MAVVYRACNPQGEPVALKILFPPPDVGAEILARFEREARTAARLNHPAIVRVIDVGQADGRAFMVMPLIKGQTLAIRLAQVGKFDEATAADVAWQIADALYYAHGHGVVHRDVKASNILLTDDGRALLTDFGVAQALDDPSLTHTGHTVGTPAYMAPEQATGAQAIDGRADLYSLGVVLYQMVTGRVPFEGTTPQVLHAHVYQPPPPPSTIAAVSPGMEAVIMQALAKDVSHRFQTGAAMAHALAQLDDQTRVEVRVTPPSSEISHRSTPKLGLWMFLFVAFLVAAAITWQFGRTATDTALEIKPTSRAAPIAFATATPSPTFAPSPSPTSTPTTSPTPAPIAESQATLPATPTIPASPTPSPPPVDTPTDIPPPPPTSTVCPQPVDGFLTPLQDLPLAEILGCPRTPAVTTPAAWQPFEKGLMLWQADKNLIYVIEGNNWLPPVGDRWREGDDPYDPSIIAPSGYYQPVRGFGLVWRQQPDVRTALGWGLSDEIGFTAIIQEFTSGQVWHDPERARFMILYNSGAYELVEGAGDNGQPPAGGE